MCRMSACDVSMCLGVRRHRAPLCFTCTTLLHLRAQLPGKDVLVANNAEKRRRSRGRGTTPGQVSLQSRVIATARERTIGDRLSTGCCSWSSLRCWRIRARAGKRPRRSRLRTWPLCYAWMHLPRRHRHSFCGLSSMAACCCDATFVRPWHDTSVIVSSQRLTIRAPAITRTAINISQRAWMYVHLVCQHCFPHPPRCAPRCPVHHARSCPE
jgi:hypothetical protein